MLRPNTGGCSAQPCSKNRAFPGTDQALRTFRTGWAFRDGVGVASPKEVLLLPPEGQRVAGAAGGSVPAALGARHIPAVCREGEMGMAVTTATNLSSDNIVGSAGNYGLRLWHVLNIEPWSSHT